MSAFRQSAILLFSLLVAANMLICLIPPWTKTATSVDLTLDPVRWSSGTWQKWDMFYTIPTHHRYDVRIVARNADGAEREFGPILPGLRKSNLRRKIRHYYTLRRTLDPASPDSAFREQYLDKVAAALRKSDPSLVDFQVHVDLELTRSLYHIDKDGKIAKLTTHVLGPFPLGDHDRD